MARHELLSHDPLPLDIEDAKIIMQELQNRKHAYLRDMSDPRKSTGARDAAQTKINRLDKITIVLSQHTGLPITSKRRELDRATA